MALLTLAPLPAIVAVSFAFVALAGCDASIHIGGDTTRRVETETVPVDGVTAIDISTDNGRVDVVAGASGDEIGIDIVMTAHEVGDATYSIDLDDGVLDIDGECDHGWFGDCSVGFVVTVPEGGNQLVGPGVTVSTDNGAITLSDLAVPIDVRTDNGAIVGAGLVAESVLARTDNGRIDLAFVEAPITVDVHTDNGAIGLLVPDTDYAVDADSDRGGVDVGVIRDDDAPRSIVAGSNNGAIDIEAADS